MIQNKQVSMKSKKQKQKKSSLDKRNFFFQKFEKIHEQ